MAQVSALLFLLVPLAARSACIPALPVPTSNNAVARADVDGRAYLLTFTGLGAGRTYRDVHRRGWVWQSGNPAWEQLPDVPAAAGRLAATAVAIGGVVYLFGGYTVAEDGSEVSTPDNFAFDVATRRFRRIAPTPVPVDDTVSFAYLQRYIYLVSGWHDRDNVNRVQVYDTAEDRWFEATGYPGSPVFGHAGGAVENRFVIADGVAVIRDAAGRRFDTVNEAWLGTIDPTDPARISYQRLPQLPGRGHYRMAGAGDDRNRRVLFAGGTARAYNYSGIGYDGQPAQPSAHVFAWLLDEARWQAYPDKPTPTMDHRGLMAWGGDWITIGGMGSAQRVLDGVHGIHSDATCDR